MAHSIPYFISWMVGRRIFGNDGWNRSYFICFGLCSVPKTKLYLRHKLSRSHRWESKDAFTDNRMNSLTAEPLKLVGRPSMLRRHRPPRRNRVKLVQLRFGHLVGINPRLAHVKVLQFAYHSPTAQTKFAKREVIDKPVREHLGRACTAIPFLLSHEHYSRTTAMGKFLMIAG